MAFTFLRAEQPPPAAFAMADHKELTLPPPPAASPASPAPVVEPLDAPAPAAKPKIIFVAKLSILLFMG